MGAPVGDSVLSSGACDGGVCELCRGILLSEMTVRVACPDFLSMDWTSNCCAIYSFHAYMKKDRMRIPETDIRNRNLVVGSFSIGETAFLT